MNMTVNRNMKIVRKKKNVTGKIAQNPAIAPNFWVPKLCAITGMRSVAIENIQQISDRSENIHFLTLSIHNISNI